MELWIRSQDKRKLIKVDEIKMETIKEGNTFIYSHATDLGDYATKERALEVLDEIQDRIAILTTIKLIGIDDESLKVFSECLEEKRCSVVYEMPKE